MDDRLIVDSSTKVFIKLGGKRKRAKELLGIIKEYKDEYTSVELQHEAMKWWKESI